MQNNKQVLEVIKP